MPILPEGLKIEHRPCGCRRREEVPSRESPVPSLFGYAGGVEAGSPGSRSAPRVHVGKGTNPGRSCSLPTLRNPPGCGFHSDTPSPGCVLRTTRGYRLRSLRDDLTPEAWDWVPATFDSDADCDPDTDAGGKGSRLDFSSFLTEAGPNGPTGEPARNRDGFR
jgi:hypothetical protein